MPNTTSTLLLADDSVTIQKVVGISFANEDVVLLTVDNGDDAIAKAREARPDLVLADVVMPGKNGYEVCEAIKTDPDLKNVPVLLLTGTFEAFDEERATRAGADGHITKPFEAQALVDQVNALLARSATATIAASAPAEPPAPEATADANAVTGGDAAPAASYDFFDDEATEPGSAPVLAQAPAARAEIDDLALGETGGQSFRFDTPTNLGDDLEVPPISDPPSAGGGGDETVILPAGSSLLEQPDPDATGPGLGAKGATMEPTAEPIFDALDDVSTLPRAAGAASADPDRRHAYDVSSTDLGSPLAGAPTAPPQPSLDETVIMSEPLVAADPEPTAPAALAFRPEPPPIPEAPLEEAPVAEPILAAPPPIPEPAPEPPALAFDRPAPAAPAAFAEPAAPEPPATREEPVAPASAEPGFTPEISPAMREEIRTALEKVAWEAFGSVAENLVKEAIERIEKIAWEVVPQLAETLVQEEIRRMKEDS